jgi:hypothetical protein
LLTDATLLTSIAMKIRFVIAVFVLACSFTASAQSSAFQSMKNTFSEDKDVVTISASGVVARVVLNLAGEREFRKSIKKVKRIRLISVPKQALQSHRTSVNNLKDGLFKTGYEALTSVKENGNEISLYLQTGTKRKNNRYFLLIDGEDEMLGIEIRGYIDAGFLMNKNLSAHK